MKSDVTKIYFRPISSVEHIFPFNFIFYFVVYYFRIVSPCSVALVSIYFYYFNGDGTQSMRAHL